MNEPMLANLKAHQSFPDRSPPALTSNNTNVAFGIGQGDQNTTTRLTKHLMLEGSRGRFLMVGMTRWVVRAPLPGSQQDAPAVRPYQLPSAFSF
jgi:hypothetical protein